MNFSLEKKGYSTTEVNAYLKKMSTDFNHVIGAQKNRIDELLTQLKEAEKQIAGHDEKREIITSAIYNAVQKAEEIERLAKVKYEQEIAMLKAFHEKWLTYYNKILKKYPIDEDLKSASEFNQRMSRILKGMSDTEGISPPLDAPKPLEIVHEDEKKRLMQKNIGFIPTDTISDSSESDGFDETIASFSDNSDTDAILGDNFDVVGRIRQYLKTHDEKPVKKPVPKKGIETASTKNSPYGTSSTGFSFEEALNPQDDIDKIMRDLGLLLE